MESQLNVTCVVNIQSKRDESVVGDANEKIIKNLESGYEKIQKNHWKNLLFLINKKKCYDLN